MTGNGVVNQYYALEIGGEEAPGGWTELRWPGIIDGYQICDLGQILSPNDTLLKPGINGKQLYVTLRTPDGEGKGLRMDKLVLGTFVGDPVDDEVPIHLDDDPMNCQLDNLKYGPPPTTPSGPKPGSKRAKKAAPRSKGAKPHSKADYDTIDVSRVYRHRGTGLMVAVDESGKAKMPKLNLSAQEMRAVVLVSQRIAEMNEILGLGKT